MREGGRRVDRDKRGREGRRVDRDKRGREGRGVDRDKRGREGRGVDRDKRGREGRDEIYHLLSHANLFYEMKTSRLVVQILFK